MIHRALNYAAQMFYCAVSFTILIVGAGFGLTSLAQAIGIAEQLVPPVVAAAGLILLCLLVGLIVASEERS